MSEAYLKPCQRSGMKHFMAMNVLKERSLWEVWESSEWTSEAGVLH